MLPKLSLTASNLPPSSLIETHRKVGFMFSGGVCASRETHQAFKLVRYFRNLVRKSLRLGWTLFGSRIGNGAFPTTEFTGSLHSTQRVWHALAPFVFFSPTTSHCA